MRSREGLHADMMTERAEKEPSVAYAAELSLMIESRKRAETVIEGEMKGIDKMIGFFDKYGDKLGKSGVFDMFLLRLELPPLGVRFEEMLKEKYPSMDPKDAVSMMEEDELQGVWFEFIQELQAMQVDLSDVQNLIPETGEWFIHSLPFNVGSWFRTTFVAGEGRGHNKGTSRSFLGRARIRGLLEEVNVGIDLIRERGRYTLDLDNDRDLMIMNESEESHDTLKAVFGDDWGDVLTETVPKRFQRYVSSVDMRAGIPFEMIDVFGQQRAGGKAAGTYNGATKEVRLSVESNAEMHQILSVWFHEMGHAVDFGEEFEKAVQIKRRFIQAVAKEANRFSIYAASCLTDSTESGLAEDYAETFSAFFNMPNILSERNPERFKAMQDIMDTYYADVDVEAARTQVKDRIKAQEIRKRTNPEVFRASIKIPESPSERMGVCSFYFSSLNRRVLDILQITGQPGEKQKRTVGEYGFITAEFNDEGRLLKESFGGVDTVKDPDYDDEGRLLSFKIHGSGENAGEEVFLTYKKDSMFPDSATVVFGGVAIAQMDFDQNGNLVTEKLTHLLMPGLEQETLQYKMDDQNRIKEIDFIIGGESVGKRAYQYDEQGRLSGKTLLFEGVEEDLVEYEYE